MHPASIPLAWHKPCRHSMWITASGSTSSGSKKRGVPAPHTPPCRQRSLAGEESLSQKVTQLRHCPRDQWLPVKTASLHLLPYMVKSKVFVATAETAAGWCWPVLSQPPMNSTCVSTTLKGIIQWNLSSLHLCCEVLQADVVVNTHSKKISGVHLDWMTHAHMSTKAGIQEFLTRRHNFTPDSRTTLCYFIFDTDL